MSKCDLCEEGYSSARRCQFGTKSKTICPKCLAQFKVSDVRIILEDRYK